jgi:hypothetical protein
MRKAKKRHISGSENQWAEYQSSRTSGKGVVGFEKYGIFGF